MGRPPLTSDAVRRRTMSRVKSKDTSIEIALRKALWHSGIRYRKHYSKLPGVPDIAITKHHIAVFCDGDFWHGKDWESKKSRIKSNSDYWINKIERNMSRDRCNDWLLYCMGWTVIRFWGSEIDKDPVDCVNKVKNAIIQKKIDNYDSYSD